MVMGCRYYTEEKPASFDHPPLRQLRRRPDGHKALEQVTVTADHRTIRHCWRLAVVQIAMAEEACSCYLLLHILTTIFAEQLCNDCVAQLRCNSIHPKLHGNRVRLSRVCCRICRGSCRLSCGAARGLCLLGWCSPHPQGISRGCSSTPQTPRHVTELASNMGILLSAQTHQWNCRERLQKLQ
jgi:hypothetical protein